MKLETVANIRIRSHCSCYCYFKHSSLISGQNACAKGVQIDKNDWRGELERRFVSSFDSVMKKMNDPLTVIRFGLNLDVDPDDIDFFLNNSCDSRLAGFKILQHLRNSSFQLAEKVETLIRALKVLELNVTVKELGLNQLAQEARDLENSSEFSYASYR